MQRNWEIRKLKALDGTAIRYGTLNHPGAEIRRYVVFLHGRSEWIEKYAELPFEIGLPEDCGFVTWDHRGQGGSGGQRGNVPSYESYVADGAQVVERVVGQLPYVQMAHSMGGLVSLMGIMSGKFQPKAFVGCSPLLRLSNDPVPRVLAKPASFMMTWMGLGDVSSGAGQYHKKHFEKNKLTHSIDMFARIKSSPFVIPGAKFRWVSETFRAVDYVFSKENFEKLAVPTLILAGSEERVVDISGISDWVQVVSRHGRGVEFGLIHGAKHELLGEVPKLREQAILRIRQWFREFLHG